MWGRDSVIREVFMPDGWDKMNWQERVNAFLATEDTAQRFTWPFPMGVFGTLRKAQGNNPLMHRGKVERVRSAFLPHFIAHGLSVSAKQNGCAPFDVFYYKPEEWARMLHRVDCLESFDPDSAHGRDNRGYYYRTLAWLRLMPEGHVCKWFPEDRPANIWEERDMKIAPENWGKYEAVPCWVYSNMKSNNKVAAFAQPSVIWPSNGTVEMDDDIWK